MSSCLIASRYRLAERIGAGGMGSVFRAYDEMGGDDVAVKLMATHLASDELAVRRFKREAKIFARLRHPNIVAGIDDGYDADMDSHYIVMELVQGDDAELLSARHGQLPVVSVLALVGQICDALAYAHEQGIVHGDVSPGNILVREADQAAKLADFGLARPRWTPADAPGRVVGTPRYIAPEIARGDSATPLSDLYSLAAVTHRLLTVDAILDRREVPAEAARAIKRALSMDPNERHVSVAAFRDDLVALRLVCAA